VPFSTSRAGTLPEASYPMPFVVKNTFIDTRVQLLESFGDFFEERKTQSCPASGIGDISGATADDHESLIAALTWAEDAQETCISEENFGSSFDTSSFDTIGQRQHSFLSDMSQEQRFWQGGSMDCPETVFERLLTKLDASFTQCTSREAEACLKGILGIDTQSNFAGNTFENHASPTSAHHGCVPPPPHQPPFLDAPIFSEMPPPPSMPPYFFEQTAPAPVLSLEAAIPPAEILQTVPSIGSWQHSSGNCRPCAFLYTRGCENGQSCEFCHLCSRGEKKKRLKEKRVTRREIRFMS
jgi:hypothetical protein